MRPWSWGRRVASLMPRALQTAAFLPPPTPCLASWRAHALTSVRPHTPIPHGATREARRYTHHLNARRSAPRKRLVVRKKRTSPSRPTAATHVSDTAQAAHTGVADDDDRAVVRASPASAEVDEVEDVVVEYPSTPLPMAHVPTFTSATPASAPSTVVGGTSGTPSLPPWPIDSVEFNARAPYGGHDKRIAAERQTSRDDTSATSSADEVLARRRPPIDPPPAASLSPAAQRARLEAVQSSASGQAALATGGWVCGQCFCPTPLASRSVCSRCFTVRHDLAFRPTPSEGRRAARHDPDGSEGDGGESGEAAARWLCRRCEEFNTSTDLVCRCCRTTRAGRHAATGDPSESATSAALMSGSAEGGESASDGRLAAHHRVVRRTVAEELKEAPLGSVLDVRGRVLRWRCAACTAINSLQARTCRHCRHERFGMALRCGHCLGATRLDNATVYGEAAAHASAPSRQFHLDNRAPVRAPRLCCSHCNASLHNATVLTSDQLSEHLHMWWCACGMTNKNMRHSCLRCRLPRLLPPTVLQELMPFLFPTNSDGSSATAAHERHRAAAGGGGGGASGVRGERGVDGGWDFEDGTHWYCQSCDGVNKASRYVVYEVANGGVRQRVARMFHGHARCQHCQAPWHHLVLPGGVYWRCACLQVNSVVATAGAAPLDASSSPSSSASATLPPTSDTGLETIGGDDRGGAEETGEADPRRGHGLSARVPAGATCLCCGLPPVDGLRPDMLSMWTPGDWYCVACRRHCYRERMRCVCGAARPGTESA